METITSKIIDLSYLEITFGGNKVIINKILKSFIDSASDLVLELTNNVNESNWENVKMIAHKMKSSYNTIGAKTTGNILERIELESAQENKTTIILLINQVKKISQQVIKEVEKELNK